MSLLSFIFNNNDKSLNILATYGALTVDTVFDPIIDALLMKNM